MMKRSLNTLLALIFFVISLPLKSQDKFDKPQIKSMVVTEEKYDMLVKKQLKEYEVYYDKQGNVVEEISYRDGKVDKHFKYSYDGDGNKIYEEEFGANGKLVKSSEYKIVNGLRVEKTVYDAGRKVKSKKYYVYTTF